MHDERSIGREFHSAGGFYDELTRIIGLMGTEPDERELARLARKKLELWREASEQDLRGYAERLAGKDPYGRGVEDIFSRAKQRQADILSGKENVPAEIVEPESLAYKKVMTELEQKTPKELGKELDEADWKPNE